MKMLVFSYEKTEFEAICRMPDGSMGLIPVPAYEIVTDEYPEWLSERGDIFVVHKDIHGRSWWVSHKETGASIPCGTDTSRKGVVEKFIRLTAKISESQLDKGIAVIKEKRKIAKRRDEWRMVKPRRKR